MVVRVFTLLLSCWANAFNEKMIDRFGREVVPLTVFQQKRPLAGQLAFGNTTRPSSSLHNKVALLPPPQVWRPRPVSEEIGSPGWNGTPVDIRPAAVLISSQFPAARDGAFTTSWNGGCKRPVTSPTGKREWCNAGPRGSQAKSSERPVTASAAIASSPRAQEAEARLRRALAEVEEWHEYLPGKEPWQSPRPATVDSPVKSSWISAGPRSYVGQRPASTQPRARVHPRAQRTLPVGGVRLPDASGAVSAPVSARPSRVSTPRERQKPGAAWVTPRAAEPEAALSSVPYATSEAEAERAAAAQHARLRRAVAAGEPLGEAELAEFGRLDRKVQPGFTPGFCPVPPAPRAGGYATPRRGGGGDAGGGGGGAAGPDSATAAALHAKLAAGDMLTAAEMATLQQLATLEEAAAGAEGQVQSAGAAPSERLQKLAAPAPRAVRAGGYLSPGRRQVQHRLAALEKTERRLAVRTPRRPQLSPNPAPPPPPAPPPAPAPAPAPDPYPNPLPNP